MHPREAEWREMVKKLLATTILAAIAAVASGVETQQTNNAARVNERIRSGLKQLGYPFVRLSGYGYTEKHWPLKQLCGKDSRVRGAEAMGESSRSPAKRLFPGGR